MTRPRQTDTLWVCHTHELIGSSESAHAHAEREGCTVHELSPETTAAVKRAQSLIRAERVAHLLAYQRLVAAS